MGFRVQGGYWVCRVLGEALAQTKHLPAIPEESWHIPQAFLTIEVLHMYIDPPTTPIWI